MIKDHLKLCLITNTQTTSIVAYKQFILKAIEGGVTCIQLREKSKSIAQIRDIALMLKEALTPFKIPLIINDYIEIAKEIDADGVHLGQSDVSPDDARQFLGANKIIGWSIETLEQLRIANELSSIDYIAASAVFPSTSKSNCKTIWGLDGLRQIIQQSKHPVIAIGGINQTNIRNIMDCGASGAAVISAIHCDKHPQKAAQRLINEMNISGEKIYV